jgi:5-methylcytosine-specific restriction endonuclease McrA
MSPAAPPRPCATPRCPGLVTERGERHCPEHRRGQDARRRGTFRERGYDGRWDRLSRLIRSRHPVCQMRLTEHCRRVGGAPSTEVHHVRPVSEHPELRLAPENLLAACHPCHMAAEECTDSEQRGGGSNPGVFHYGGPRKARTRTAAGFRSRGRR